MDQHVKLLFEEGKYSQCWDILSRKIDASRRISKPELVLLHDSRSACAAKMGRIPNAVHDAKTMISLIPSDPRGYLRLAKICSGMKRPTEAVRVLEDAYRKYGAMARKDPLWGTVRSNIAKLKVSLGRVGQCDPLRVLPYDVVIDVLSPLSTVELLRLRRVSRTWRQAIEGCIYLWRRQIDFTKQTTAAHLTRLSVSTVVRCIGFAEPGMRKGVPATVNVLSAPVRGTQKCSALVNGLAALRNVKFGSLSLSLLDNNTCQRFASCIGQGTIVVDNLEVRVQFTDALPLFASQADMESLKIVVAEYDPSDDTRIRELINWKSLEPRSRLERFTFKDGAAKRTESEVRHLVTFLLESCQNLRDVELEFAAANPVEPISLSVGDILNHWPQLQSLRLAGGGLRFVGLADCPPLLRVLHLSRCSATLGPRPPQSRGDSLKVLKLKEISVIDCGTNGRLFSLMAKMRLAELETLIIDASVGSALEVFLNHCPKLVELDSGTVMNDQTVRNIGTCCPALRHVDVSSSMVTGDGMRRMSEAGIKNIYCHDCRVSTADLSWLNNQGVVLHFGQHEHIPSYE